MKILDFLMRKRGPQKDNQLERMLKDGSFRDHYKGFFEVLMHSEVIILGVMMEGRQVSLETTTVEGLTFGYVYTSEQALCQVLAQRSLSSDFIEVSGKSAIQMFLEAGVGMQMNAELPENIFFTPGNLKFIASEFKIDRVQPEP